MDKDVGQGRDVWRGQKAKSLDEALKNADVWLSSEIEDRFGATIPKKHD